MAGREPRAHARGRGEHPPMRRRRRPTLVALSLLVGACALFQPPRYVAPVGSPTAVARFEIETDAFFALVYAFPEQCTKRDLAFIGSSRWIRKSGWETSNLNMLDGHSTADPKRAERIIQADTRFLFQVLVMGDGGAYCKVAMSFVPEAGEEYEIRTDVLTPPDQRDDDLRYCSVAVRQLVSDDAGTVSRVDVPSESVEPGTTCFWSY